MTVQERGTQPDYGAGLAGELVDLPAVEAPFTPETAQAELDAIFIDGFDGDAHKSFSRGRTDIAYGRDTEDAQFHIRVEGLLDVANRLFDTPRS